MLNIMAKVTHQRETFINYNTISLELLNLRVKYLEVEQSIHIGFETAKLYYPLVFNYSSLIFTVIEKISTICLYVFYLSIIKCFKSINCIFDNIFKGCGYNFTLEICFLLCALFVRSNTESIPIVLIRKHSGVNIKLLNLKSICLISTSISNYKNDNY